MANRRLSLHFLSLLFVVTFSGFVTAAPVENELAEIYAEDPGSTDNEMVRILLPLVADRSLSRAEIEFNELGSTLWGRPHYGKIQDDLLFVCFPHGLVIYDISDSTSAVELSGVAVDAANDIEIAGDYAYVACGHDNTYNQFIAGLAVVDITDPAAPVLINKYLTIDRARGLYIDGNRLYLATAYEGIMVFDISEPTAPTVLGTFGQLTHPYDIVVRDTLGFTNLTNEFRIINVADPTDISLISTYDPLGYPVRIDLRGNYAFVACDFGLMTIDISNPAIPTSADYFGIDPLESLTDMHLDGNRVYLGARETDVEVLDATSVFSLTQLDEYADSTQKFTRSCVQARGDYAYIIDSGYIGVLDVKDGGNVELIEQTYLPGAVYDVYVAGTKAYVATGEGLTILDISASAAPTVLGSRRYRGRNINVEVIGDTAYMAGGSSGALIFDVANPSAPTLISVTNVGNPVRSVEKIDTLLYLTTYDYFIILNVSDIVNPAVVSQTLAPNPRDSQVKDSAVFLASMQYGTSIMNISDIQNPTYYTSFYYTNGFSTRLHLVGDTLFVLVGKSGLGGTDKIDMFNVSDPLTPIHLSTVAIEGFAGSNDFDFQGNYVYVSSWVHGIAAINISNVATPWFAGSRYTAGSTYGVGISGNRLVAADGFGAVLFETTMGYICGNVDGSINGGGPIDISDLTYLVDFLFNGGLAPPIMQAANVDGVTTGGLPVDISDLTYLVEYLFAGGPAPVCE